MRSLLPLILFAASVCFALGIVLPLIHAGRLYFFSDEPSQIGMIAALWSGGDWPLAIVVALFSGVFPAMKLGLLHNAAYAQAGNAASIQAGFARCPTGLCSMSYSLRW